MVVFLIPAGVLFALAVVFYLGRQIGRTEGRRTAEAEWPIEMRARLQLEGRCPICDDARRYPILSSQKQG
ncbi:hypothetical protein [Alicyclobacillus acidiphilus]|uniref:hypothetical protein n=1 Tax=Alicyclobacillus acidiphilus TaxID=182455 RepID=UPI0008361257|nr:hypothetical protein [Alicyclobacillus acidiphilus]